MNERLIKKLSEDFGRKVRGELDQLRELLVKPSRLEELELRLENLEGKILAGTKPEAPEPVESGAFLRSLSAAVANTQAELLREPGSVQYAIGPVKTQIKAHLEDRDGQLMMHLPQPGQSLQEATLAHVDFTLVPLGESEEEPEGEEVLVPSVVGQPVGLARKQLEAAGLTVGDLDDTPHDGPSDRVLGQSPRAGATLLEGAPVNLTVASSRFVTLPNLVGAEQEVAVASLRQLGLRFRRRKLATADFPAGTVIDHEPAAEAAVERRSMVNLTVAVPKPKERQARPGRRVARKVEKRVKRSSKTAPSVRGKAK